MKARAERVARAMLATLEAAIAAETRATKLARHLGNMERLPRWLVSEKAVEGLEDRVLAAETAACELYDAYVALARLWHRLAAACDAPEQAYVDEFNAAYAAYMAQRSSEHASGEKPSRRNP